MQQDTEQHPGLEPLGASSSLQCDNQVSLVLDKCALEGKVFLVEKTLELGANPVSPHHLFQLFKRNQKFLW